MQVQDKVTVINEVVEKLFKFLNNNEELKKQIDEMVNSGKIQAESTLAYLVDVKLKDGSTVLQKYREQENNISDSEKKALDGIEQSISSLFEVKQIKKDGFSLYNLVNELEYDVTAMVKMINFRGVGLGNFIAGRITPFEDKYYLVDINNVISSTQRKEALKYAVSKQMQKPELLYENNSEKLNQIQEIITKTGEKFNEYFNCDEFITTSKAVDVIISDFNDFVDDEDVSRHENIEQPEGYSYFDVKELSQGAGDFLETASKGFSAHEKVYDVGVIFDESSGLLVTPFYGTFKQIFQVDDYKSINGYKECIANYLESSRITPFILQKVYESNKDRFLSVINEVLDSSYTFDSLINQYKSSFENKKYFSSTSILYASNAFNELMNFVDVQESPAVEEKVGRNEPCPCGSGKKYKKCCLK